VEEQQKHQVQCNKVIMTKILLCDPSHYGITYKINPWMDPKNGANRVTAITQWKYLRDKLEDLGAELHYIKPQKNLPDMVFTANAGIVSGNKFFISRFSYPERQGEEKFFIEWFEDNGYITYDECGDHSCEGAGDILIAHDIFWNGWGFRSDPDVGVKVHEDSFSDHFLATIRLMNPDFYHLDTCLCPLKPGVVIANLDAFGPGSVNLIKHLCDVIQPPPIECRNFACNSIVLDDNVIMPDGCPVTARKVEAAGFEVHIVPMSEFIKSGGACKCLTLVI